MRFDGRKCVSAVARSGLWTVWDWHRMFCFGLFWLGEVSLIDGDLTGCNDRNYEEL
jgi:hypothetical protein